MSQKKRALLTGLQAFRQCSSIFGGTEIKVLSVDTMIEFKSSGSMKLDSGIIVMAKKATVHMSINHFGLCHDDSSPLIIQSGAKVELTLNGLNSLTCSGSHQPGIRVEKDAALTIYGPGTLVAEGDSYGAGIGTYDNSKTEMGNVTITDGAVVHAYGGKEAAGIGSGNEAKGGGNLTISGANTKVYATSTGNYGAGIGGGDQSGGLDNLFIIDGAYVEATGGKGGAGIGSGDKAAGMIGPIHISNARVKATGGKSAAGIGSGNESLRPTLIEIANRAYVESYGGAYGAGIGGGETSGGGTIRILSGSYVNAVGSGGLVPYGGGAGIGSGNGAYHKGSSYAGDILIDGSGTVVYATGGKGGAGIGSGDFAGDSGSITIRNGYVTAKGGGTWAAGIGGGNRCNGAVVTISGGTVEAYGADNGAGIGSGDLTKLTMISFGGDGGELNVSGGKVTAVGGSGGAGIGFGSGAPFIVKTHLAVNISGGEVYATGGHNAAGIGGGEAGMGGTVCISGGIVVAQGGPGGAGIGGGHEDLGIDAFAITNLFAGSNGDTTITGGTVTARSGKPYPLDLTGISLQVGVGAFGIGGGSFGKASLTPFSEKPFKLSCIPPISHGSLDVTGGSVLATNYSGDTQDLGCPAPATRTIVALDGIPNNTNLEGARIEYLGGAVADYSLHDVITQNASMYIRKGTTTGCSAIYLYTKVIPYRIVLADGSAYYRTNEIIQSAHYLDGEPDSSGKMLDTGYFYAKATYQVHFDSNEGTGEMATQSFDYGVEQALVTNQYTRKGFAFKGWSLTKNATKVDYVDGQAVTNIAGDSPYNTSVTLYAVWAEKPNVMVSYTTNDTNKGTVNKGVEIIPQDDDAVGAVVSSKTGYHFVNWTNKADNIISDKTTLIPKKVHSSVVYIANFAGNDYEVAFDNNGGNGSMDNQAFVYGEKQALHTCSFTRSNYHFVGWSIDKNATVPSIADEQKIDDLVTDGNITLYAIWEQDSPSDPLITLIYNEEVGDSIETQLETFYSSKQPDGYTARVYTGYSFQQWVNDHDGSTVNNSVLTSENMTSAKENGNWRDTTYTAKYQPITYQISFDKNGDDVIGSVPNTIDADYDKGYSLPDPSGLSWAGHQFVGWSTTQDTTAEYLPGSNVMNLTTTANETITFYAIWKENDVVAVTFTPSSTDMGRTSPVVELLDAGDTPTGSTAITKIGYRFLNWTDEGGNEVSSNAILDQLNAVDKDTTYTANFVGNTYSILYDKNADDAIGTMSTQDMSYGSTNQLNTCTLTREGYVFTGWNVAKDGTDDAYQDEEEVKNLLQNQGDQLTLYAQWEAEDRTYTVEYYNSLIGNEFEQVGDQPLQVTGKVGEKVNVARFQEDVYGYTLVNTTYQASSVENTEDEVTVQSDNSLVIRLYYIATPYDIVFDGNGSSNTMDNQPMIYSIPLNLPACSLKRPGYYFTGWNSEPDGSGNRYKDAEEVLNLTPYSETTLYAQWSKDNSSKEDEDIPNTSVK